MQQPIASRANREPRYWWHHLPGCDYEPAVYAQLNEDERAVMRAWYDEGDTSGQVGESAVPLISLLHGIVMGNCVRRIAQLGTHTGYSALLLGFMLRRMKAQRGLLTFDIDPDMCATARRWIERAGLTSEVEVVEMSSLDPAATRRVTDFFGAPAEVIVIDSSHEYASTLRELDIWYEALAQGGMLVLHDVSRFAAAFDTTRQGGVQRAFFEWRSANPEAETFCVNADVRSMSEPRPLYKDACGVGLVHKPLA